MTGRMNVMTDRLVNNQAYKSAMLAQALLLIALVCDERASCYRVTDTGTFAAAGRGGQRLPPANRKTHQAGWRRPGESCCLPAQRL